MCDPTLLYYCTSKIWIWMFLKGVSEYGWKQSHLAYLNSTDLCCHLVFKQGDSS